MHKAMDLSLISELLKSLEKVFSMSFSWGCHYFFRSCWEQLFHDTMLFSVLKCSIVSLVSSVWAVLWRRSPSQYLSIWEQRRWRRPITWCRRYLTRYKTTSSVICNMPSPCPIQSHMSIPLPSFRLCSSLGSARLWGALGLQWVTRQLVRNKLGLLNPLTHLYIKTVMCWGAHYPPVPKQNLSTACSSLCLCAALTAFASWPQCRLVGPLVLCASWQCS